ncbi:MBL fold metallo-hydrolase [Neobacillus sp. LXY-4]|uniref:MBL fold metallo-hydrolase n=1 Tax=Neobacillus sp. LXY-4 TaxID=3379826 RepID=UPI003EE203EB
MGNQKLIKFSERIFYLSASHETDRPILGAIIGDQHVLMVDGGNSPKHINLFYKELADHGIPKPSFVVLTHWHWDHIFGLSQFNIPIIAHIKTANHMLRLQGLKWDDASLNERVQTGKETSFCAEMIKKEFKDKRDIQICMPNILFEDKLFIDLGNLTCQIEHVGGDHSDDSTVIYVQDEQFLFLGDCNSCDIYSEKRQYTKANVVPLLERLERFQAQWYLHSHSEPINRTEFLQENRECRSILESLNKHGEHLDLICKDVQPIFGRNLTQDDLEFIQYFINGKNSN